MFLFSTAVMAVFAMEKLYSSANANVITTW